MLIQYNGPHPEVVVDEHDTDQVIVRGEPVDIPDDLAARLLEQDTWSQIETAEQKAAREKRQQDEAAAAQAAQAEADAKAAAEAAAAKAAADAADTATGSSN